MMLGLVREGLPRQSAHEETGPAGGVDGCTMLSAGWSRERWGKMHTVLLQGAFLFAATADGRVDLGGGWREMFNALGAMLFTWWNALGESAGTLQGNGLVQGKGRGGR